MKEAEIHRINSMDIAWALGRKANSDSNEIELKYIPPCRENNAIEENGILAIDILHVNFMNQVQLG